MTRAFTRRMHVYSSHKLVGGDGSEPPHLPKQEGTTIPAELPDRSHSSLPPPSWRDRFMPVSVQGSKQTELARLGSYIILWILFSMRAALSKRRVCIESNRGWIYCDMPWLNPSSLAPPYLPADPRSRADASASFSAAVCRWRAWWWSSRVCPWLQPTPASTMGRGRWYNIGSRRTS